VAASAGKLKPGKLEPRQRYVVTKGRSLQFLTNGEVRSGVHTENVSRYRQLVSRLRRSTLRNVALHKPATQSSSFDGYRPKHALDGQLDTLTHTDGDTADPISWWQVDLLKAWSIQSVVLHNRQGVCESRLRDIHVEVFGDDGETVLFRSPLLNPENTLNSPALIVVNIADLAGEPVVGRYVRVSRIRDEDNSGGPATSNPDELGVLSLGEVEVHAEPSKTTASITTSVLPLTANKRGSQP